MFAALVFALLHPLLGALARIFPSPLSSSRMFHTTEFRGPPRMRARGVPEIGCMHPHGRAATQR